MEKDTRTCLSWFITSGETAGGYFFFFLAAGFFLEALLTLAFFAITFLILLRVDSPAAWKFHRW
jgi:hypothetical protein